MVIMVHVYKVNAIAHTRGYMVEMTAKHVSFFKLIVDQILVQVVYCLRCWL